MRFFLLTVALLFCVNARITKEQIEQAHLSPLSHAFIEQRMEAAVGATRELVSPLSSKFLHQAMNDRLEAAIGASGLSKEELIEQAHESPLSSKFLHRVAEAQAEAQLGVSNMEQGLALSTFENFFHNIGSIKGGAFNVVIFILFGLLAITGAYRFGAFKTVEPTKYEKLIDEEI